MRGMMGPKGPFQHEAAQPSSKLLGNKMELGLDTDGFGTGSPGRRRSGTVSATNLPLGMANSPLLAWPEGPRRPVSRQKTCFKAKGACVEPAGNTFCGTSVRRWQWDHELLLPSELCEQDELW